MKVKAIDPNLVLKLYDPKMTLVPNTVYDLPDDMAKRLVEAHLVVRVEEPQDKEKEAS